MDTNKMREKYAEVRSSLAGQMIQGDDWGSAYRAADEILSFESFRLGWEAYQKSAVLKMPQRALDHEEEAFFDKGWNACLDQFARLNGVKP